MGRSRNCAVYTSDRKLTDSWRFAANLLRIIIFYILLSDTKVVTAMTIYFQCAVHDIMVSSPPLRLANSFLCPSRFKISDPFFYLYSVLCNFLCRAYRLSTTLRLCIFSRSWGTITRTARVVPHSVQQSTRMLAALVPIQWPAPPRTGCGGPDRWALRRRQQVATRRKPKPRWTTRCIRTGNILISMFRYRRSLQMRWPHPRSQSRALQPPKHHRSDVGQRAPANPVGNERSNATAGDRSVGNAGNME